MYSRQVHKLQSPLKYISTFQHDNNNTHAYEKIITKIKIVVLAIIIIDR